MKNFYKKGFTLIELLVVIAIIGILASVVLASLNTARAKGADAATKANLANMRGQAELEYDTYGDYDTVCAANGATQNTTIASAMAAVLSSSGVAGVCAKPATGVATNWAASGTLKQTNVVSGTSGTDYWCVDSSGASKAIDTNITATATSC